VEAVEEAVAIGVGSNGEQSRTTHSNTQERLVVEAKSREAEKMLRSFVFHASAEITRR
jgi:hypothetical protein